MNRQWLGLVVAAWWILSGSPAHAQPIPFDGQFRDVLSCCQVLTTTGAYVQTDWWVGPGVTGSVQISTIPYGGDGRQFLNLDWLVPPQWPGVDPMADGRETVLEYHAGGQVLPLDGGRVRLAFLAATSRPTTIVPIVWPMYRQGAYWIIPCDPVDLQAGQWRYVVCEIQLPSVGGRIVGSENYLGIGVDLPPQTGLPHLVIGEVTLEVIP